MPRIARIVIPGIPHHVTQRGNRRLKTFFGNRDFLRYRTLLAEWTRKWDVEIWAYCLMTNHVHFIAVPTDETGLRKAMQEIHCRYTRGIHRRKRWRGHLWQGRFFSFPMDEAHVLRAARYIERSDYPWSSARAHLAGEDDGLVRVRPLLDRVDRWADFLMDPLTDEDAETLHRHERSGRPLGNESFIKALEARTGRIFTPGRPGRRPLAPTS